MVEIRDYEDRFAASFREMNLEWLDKYELTESHDLQVLQDPKGTILDRGGFIFLAMQGETPVGSAALMSAGEKQFELAKMSVVPAWRGKGISKLLLDHCIKRAMNSGAERLILYSNHKLTTALALYERFGFNHVPVINSPFETADVMMELDLGQISAGK
jgi:GNAT superfamily N-acetyltransferase